MLARERKFNPLRNIHRVVADALEIFCDHQKVDTQLAVSAILTDEADQLPPHGREKIVHHIVITHHGIGKLKIFFTKESMLSVTILPVAFAMSAICTLLLLSFLRMYL